MKITIKEATETLLFLAVKKYKTPSELSKIFKKLAKYEKKILVKIKKLGMSNKDLDEMIKKLNLEVPKL